MHKLKAMSKKYFSLGLFILGWIPFQAAENQTLLIPQSSLTEVGNSLTDEDEIKAIDQLIQTTAEQLEVQKHIRELMLQFQKLKEEFVQGKQTKSHTAQMVKTARQIYELITANHLEHLFTKDYLDELAFFSSIAGKGAVKRP